MSVSPRFFCRINFVARRERNHLLHLQIQARPKLPSGTNSAMVSGMDRTLFTAIYFPFHTGCRFSRNALIPSWTSSVFINSSR